MTLLRVALLLVLLLGLAQAFRLPVCMSQLDPAVTRELWSRCDRALLRVGSKGVSSGHQNSLKELLAAHAVVRVKFNGFRSDEDVQSAAASLLEGHGEIVDSRGPNVLFATSDFVESLRLPTDEADTALPEQ
eukprot:scaffold8163_cov258-Pinguiococcus_pyrenoidosus.AAC.1